MGQRALENQPREFSTLNLGPPCMKVANLSQTWPFATDPLGLLANCPFAEWMGCV